MLVVALTGGIGSGKSLVLSLFAEIGCQVINMDDISKQLSEPEQAAYSEIVESFGKQILSPDGKIDRKALAQLVFNNPLHKQKLERILHPPIERIVRQQLKEAESRDPKKIVLVEIPLLKRRRQFDFIDRILVVECSSSLQIERVRERDISRSRKEIQLIIDSQISEQERRCLADDVLSNTQSVQALKNKVEQLYKQYQQLS